MPAGVTIDKTDLASLDRSLDAIKKGVPDAIRFATNDSMSALKTAASREIRNHVTAQAKYVNRDIAIKKMYPSDMTANVTAKGLPLPLVAYKHSKTMKGMKIQVLKQGVTKLVKHSFKARMKSTHEGIFWRQNREGGTGKWPVGKYKTLPSPRTGSPLRKYQLKITERYGPRVPDVLKQDKVMSQVLQEASDRYDARLEYHTNRLLDKARAA